MKEWLITFRTITFAQRGERAMKKNGIPCVLQRSPKAISQRGCGYCLRIQTDRLGEITGLLRRSGVDYRKVYLLQADGGTQEIRL